MRGKKEAPNERLSVRVLGGIIHLALTAAIFPLLLLRSPFLFSSPEEVTVSK